MYPKLTLLFSAFLFSCSGPSDRTSAETAYALLKNPGSFFWYSNDQAVGDSALQHLPGGVISPLQKQGNYHFKIAGNYTSPEIQIYPLSVSGNSMRVSSQGETVVLKKTGEGVWEGDWIGSDQAEIRRCVLLSDGSRRAAVPQGAWITGSGNHEASVALEIIVLSQTAYQTQTEQAALRQAIQSEFAKIYGPAGISLSGVKIIPGSQHPKYGNSFSQGSAFQLVREDWALEYKTPTGTQTMDFDELSKGFSGADAAHIQIALVDSVKGALNVIGLSPFHGQSVLEGSASTIELSGYYRAGSNLKKSQATEIASTLAHEFGHFLGLRHTTVHLENRTDLSIVEDALMDTPYSRLCSSAQAVHSGAMGSAWQIAQESISSSLCPDVSNLMFPFVDQSQAQETLSETQKTIVFKNLSLLPRE